MNIGEAIGWVEHAQTSMQVNGDAHGAKLLGEAVSALRARLAEFEKALELANLCLAQEHEQRMALLELRDTDEWRTGVKIGQYLVQIEVQKREIKELKDKINALKDAVVPVTCWWSFIRVGAELDEHEIKPEAAVLHYMGNGGSTVVTAAALDKISELSREE